MVVAGVIHTVGTAAAFAVQQKEKPNILFLAIDDMNDWAGFLGGHPQAITPNMDRLARHGVSFTNAHCPAPGCSPSRNAILYGVEPFRSGLYAFYDQPQLPQKLLENYTSLPRLFKNNGYNTYRAGKIYHPPTSSTFKTKEWTEFFRVKKPSLVYEKKAGYRQGKSNKMHFAPTLNPLEEHVDYQNASFGVDILSQEHDRSFFLAVGMIKPHLPFTCPKQFFDLYPETVEPPATKPDDLDDIPWVGQQMILKGDDAQFKKDNAWNDVRRAYLACISWVDYNIGRVLEALDNSPYADNTIIILWSDHGYALGEKQHFRKFALWEEITRVPFVIWDKRDETSHEGRQVNNAVSLINIYRTLTDLSGLTPPAYVDGVSLAPQLENPSEPVGYPAVCSWGRGNYTVRTETWRYIRYFDGSEELYSHTKDPNEWTNLARNPEYDDVKQRLAELLPEQEAPLVAAGLEKWSLPVSADKHRPDK